MRDFIVKYYQFILMLIVWCLASFFGGSLAAISVVGVSLVFLFLSKSFVEIFMGFFFILILSDNLSEYFEFAKTFKNAYILLLSAIIVVKHGSFYPLRNLHMLFVPFFIIASLGLMYSGNISVGIQKTASYILLLIVIPNFLVFCFKEHSATFLKELILFLVLIIASGFLMGLLNYDFAFIEGGRLRGFFGNPNGLGIFLFVVYMFYVVTNNFYPDIFTRQDRILINIIVLSAVLFCGSRSAMVSISMLLLFHRIQHNSPLLGVLIFVLIIVSYQFITSNFVLLVKYAGLDDYLRVNTLEEGSGRFVAWSFAWEKIQNFYYIGGGFGNDEYVMRQNYRFLSFLGHQGGVHNSYLTLWFDAGIVGVFFYFRAFIALFINGAKKTLFAIPCLYSILFSITYESWLAGSLNPFTGVMFLTVSLLYCEDFYKIDPISETSLNSNITTNLELKNV